MEQKRKVYILVKNFLYDYESVTSIEGISYDKTEIEKLYETEKNEEIKRCQNDYGDSIDEDGDNVWEYTETEKKDNFQIWKSGYSVEDSCTIFIEEKEI